jgi:hypothetical protein
MLPDSSINYNYSKKIMSSASELLPQAMSSPAFAEEATTTTILNRKIGGDVAICFFSDLLKRLRVKIWILEACGPSTS